MVLGKTTGDHEVLKACFDQSRRLAIAVGPGANRNAFAGGALVSIRERNLHHKVAAWGGCSSGIATCGYIAGSGSREDTKVFSHDTNDHRLLSVWRWFLGKPMFDVDYADRVFQGIETGRGINATRVIESGIPFYAILSDPNTGQHLVFRAETPDEVHQLASVGAAVTGISRKVYFRGREVSDGFFTLANFPLEAIVEQCRQEGRGVPTDILVFAGKHLDPQPKRKRWSVELAHLLGLARYSEPVRRLMKDRYIHFYEAHERALVRTDIRVLVVWNPTKLPAFKIPKEESEKLIETGYQTMEHLFRSLGR